MNLVTWAEAVAWICTRNSEDMAALAEIAPNSQLGVVMRSYRAGVKFHVRCRLEGEDQLTSSLDGGGAFASAQQALHGLQTAVLAGLLPIRAFAQGSAARAIVPFEDLANTEWRFWDPDGGPSGFWSHTQGRFAWREPVLVLSDLESLWPAPLAGRRSKAATRIRTALMGQEGKLKKDDALAIVKNSDGYSRAIFEDVWKEFPQIRKFGRGERGPSLRKRTAKTSRRINL